MNQTIFLGAGCFWCVEAVFQNLKGVASVVSGYTGGALPNPTYKEVCTGTTGHAEVCKVEFNPEILSTEQLLIIFFTTHDPTTLNRQGNDIGSQYRSVIYYTTEEQKKTAEEVLTRVNPDFDNAIVTTIEPAGEFYPAEEYHQNYFNENGYQPYCMFVVAPKVKKFREKYAHLLK